MPIVTNDQIIAETSTDEPIRLYGEGVATYVFTNGDAITLCLPCKERAGIKASNGGEPQAPPVVCEWCQRNENSMRTLP